MLTANMTNQTGTILTDSLRSAAPRRNKKMKWKYVLPETLVGDYLVVPLTSAKMLKSESYSMNNCSRDYTALCSNGVYALFSIRKRTGERLATLGVAGGDGRWMFDQCYGPSNSEVVEEIIEYFDDEGILQTEWLPTDIYFVAHEVVRLMNSMVVQ